MVGKMVGPSIFYFLRDFPFFAISIGSKLKSFGRFVWALGDIYLQVGINSYINGLIHFVWAKGDNKTCYVL